MSSQTRNTFTDRSFTHTTTPNADGPQKWFWRAYYFAKSLQRRIRVLGWVTKVLGPQYIRSRDLIEIDITYACNLHCINCNRSVTQAPEALHMPLAQVADFVDESVHREKKWRRIRVLGGEPTVHPNFLQIIDELLRYVSWNPDCIVEVATNGFGTQVESQLAKLPSNVRIDNSSKTSPIQPHFGPFNLAPIDDPKFRYADFRNACFVTETCGMGLTPNGYYPCAVAGGIDRVLGAGFGRKSLPPERDDMLNELSQLCRLCGRFRDGHFVPRALRPELKDSQISPSWADLYSRWQRRKLETEGSFTTKPTSHPIDQPSTDLTH